MVHLAVAIALGIIIACIAIPVGAVALGSIVELFRSEPKPLSPEVKKQIQEARYKKIDYSEYDRW